jgi:hypothetical protein
MPVGTRRHDLFFDNLFYPKMLGACRISGRLAFWRGPAGQVSSDSSWRSQCEAGAVLPLRSSSPRAHLPPALAESDADHTRSARPVVECRQLRQLLSEIRSSHATLTRSAQGRRRQNRRQGVGRHAQTITRFGLQMVSPISPRVVKRKTSRGESFFVRSNA